MESKRGRTLHEGDQIDVNILGQRERGTATDLINRGKTLVVRLLNGWMVKVSSSTGWDWPYRDVRRT